ncbi:Rad9-domain-containing protein [Scheffersomyces coipomensis]|uniref:Rad9-domain-containing protein n=1 Tax=Scheffersomyces coipomensis TaxID=1788519 RepID=UPI00315DF52A
MSFVGVFDSKKHTLIWSKSIMALSGLSEHIKFVISDSSLSIAAVNSAKTSHAEITFTNSFFDEYSVDFKDVMDDGYEIDYENNDTSYYSFIVNSKHLATLFRNLDAKDLDYICLKVYWSKTAPVTMQFKLLIEIKTKSLIVKKYQTNYQPVYKNSVNIAALYKKELIDNQIQIESADRIKYLMIEQIIPKQFLDMVPSSTEDFKIEVKPGKTSFTAYTKQVLKDRDYLRQPMSVTISLNPDDFPNSNFKEVFESETDYIFGINFRLKDFRNFLTLAAFITSSLALNTSEDDYVDIDSNDYFEIFFKNPGDPIIFELKNVPYVSVQFIQITSADNTEDQPVAKKVKTTFALQSNVVHRILGQESQRSKSPSVTQSIPLPLRMMSKSIGEVINFTERRFQPTNVSARPNNNMRSMSRSRSPSMSIHNYDSGEDVITYRYESERVADPEPQRQKAPTTKAKQKGKRTIINRDADTDYSESEEENDGNKKREISLGPTQLQRPKSIFD